MLLVIHRLWNLFICQRNFKQGIWDHKSGLPSKKNKIGSLTLKDEVIIINLIGGFGYRYWGSEN